MHLSIQLSQGLYLSHTDTHNSQLLQKLKGAMKHKISGTTKNEVITAAYHFKFFQEKKKILKRNRSKYFSKYKDVYSMKSDTGVL